MSGGGTAPTPYQPTGQAAADQSFQTGQAALSAGGANVQATAIPAYQSIYNQVSSNPYYGQAQATAGNVASAGQTLGAQSLNDANGLAALGQSLGQYATPIIQTGFDPQGSLYNRTQQQTSDQTNAINAMNGVAGSPYGAGLAAQANNNFNIDWQNNAQTRQNSAIGALGTLDSNIMGLYGGAQSLGAQGLDTMTATGQLPSEIFLNQEKANSAAIDQLVAGDNSAYSLTQQATADAGNYLNIGQTASAGALNAFKEQQSVDSAFWGAIGDLAGTAGQIALGI
jgi:hypothetical protein